MEHPYRTGPAVDAPRRGVDSTQARALPLVVMAVAFFLPAARGCDHEVLSPASVALSGAVQFVSPTPIYLGAALLAIAIALSYTTRRTADTLAGFGTAMAVGSAIFGFVVAVSKDPSRASPSS